MARRRRSFRVRRYLPRIRRRGGSVRGRTKGFMSALVGAIGTLIGLYVGSKFASGYAVPVGLGIGGLGAYLFDGSDVGAALIGSAVATAVAPLVMGGAGSQKPPTPTNMWV